MKESDLELLAEEMFEAWTKKHKEVYAKMYEDAEFMFPELRGKYPPKWEGLDENLKQCWIAAAKYAMDEYIS